MLRKSLQCHKFKLDFSRLLWLAILSLCSVVVIVQSQDASDYDGIDNPAALSLITQLVYSRLSNMTVVVNQELGEKSSFCVKNSDDDWNRAFNFSSNLTFLSSCIQKTRGDVTRRLCTAAEIKLYFDNVFERSGNANNANYLKPNRNCNLTSWVNGCEPGWACSATQNVQLDFKNSQVIPARTTNCQACCEGFFCPHGITCMIPCPLGSYCPVSRLNNTTGMCEPYLYQLPPGQLNHTCGGANNWADASSSSEIFCAAGSFCPTTTEKNPCGQGSYCRMGSTVESRCFKLNSCDTNSSKQNIHIYGAMLIAALSTLLLIIYNCSDQVLATRERRLSKSREAAAKSARETARARQKWKAAKDAAKKHARGLQAQLSRSFSRKIYYEKRESMYKTEDDQLSPLRLNDSSAVLPSSATVKEKQKEPVELMEVIHEIENDPHVYDENESGSDFKSSSVNIQKGKLHTHSQIFRYAYSELEKENAQQQDNKALTFSGVLKMATDTNKRKRPLIEISFKDLTLTLKAKDKHLLRCVTGRIKPGRITAVMGPSGAGKTTLLSAIAGKVFGCKTTGSILINGKNDSIHSYKKIIGFVPQDDIVHGNLTVEENLWFSAKCRLSANLLKPDKVLIVERVIQALGLQAVRDSLVGTVEKRGISGGQRKRVNVGLEMVMEPSLLILDEPTSGLDSASSQLLLRALRREALEGVNICLVVHQPSYVLFKMFDDLILLAKGGLTVYHGPVNKVEEYFSGLGINIPERINPPDYFIDILEGIVIPDGSLGISNKELPLRWMLYNGYPIPPDMCRQNSGLAMSSAGVLASDRMLQSSSSDSDNIESFAGELWQDVMTNVEMHRDKIRFNFLKSKDLSHRRTPGIILQYKYFLARVGKQRLREAKTQAIDYLILLLAGACLGSLAKMSDQNMGAAAYTYTVIAVSLLCKIAALRSFSQEKLQYWRERNSGMSSLAYFLSKDTIDHFNTVIKPVVYLSMFYFFTNPRSTFAENYIVLICLVYCVTGIGYAFAILFDPGVAQLWSVLLPVVLTLIATQSNNNEILKYISDLCYSKWALEALVIANAQRYYGVWLITRCGALKRSGYDVNDWNLCICILILIGVVSRAIAFFSMLIFHKK